MIPSPTVEFEFTPGAWTSAAHRLHKPSGLTITRGRENELVAVSPGECAFVLSNDDGCYTQGLTSSEVGRNLYPNPRMVAGGTLTGVASRFTSSWTTAARTGVAPPVPGLTTAWRAACTASDPGVGRGLSLAGDPAEVTPSVDNGVTTTPGASYVVSCYVRASRGAMWQILARFHTGAGAWATTFLFSPVVIATADTWVRVMFPVVSPSGGARLAIAVATTDSVPWASGDSIDVTGVQVEAGQSADYHDGVYGPLDRLTAWVGTAHASASTLTTIIYPTRRFVPVRVNTSGRRFTGYVDSWSVTVTMRGKLSECTVRCVDRMALDSLKTLRGHGREVIESLSPLAYWDLTGELTGGQVPGGLAAPMIPRYAGTAGGELGWAAGIMLPGDDAAGVQFTPALSDTEAMVGGYRLESLYVPPSSYSVILAYGKPLQDGPMLRLGGAKVDARGGAAVFIPASGPEVPLTAPIEVLSVNASGVILSSDPTRQYITPAAPLTKVQVGGTMIGSTPAWSGASVSHVAVIPYVAPADMNALVARLAMAPRPVETVVGDLLKLSGAGAATVTRLGAAQSVVGAATASQGSQDVINQIAQGALGRYYVDMQGTPTWVSWDYAPAIITQPSEAGVMLDGLVYEVDVSAWVTDVTTTLPSGGTYTISDATGLARSSMELQHVLDTDADARAVAGAIVGRSTDVPRLKSVSFDLLGLASGSVATLLGVGIGSRLTITGLPPQIPSPQTVVVEGLSETLTERSWSLSLTTSPAPSFDWFAWGNAWGSKRWKPF